MTGHRCCNAAPTHAALAVAALLMSPLTLFAGPDWEAMTSGTAEDLHGIWGSGPNLVFAVGGSGTILRYDGTLWSAEDSGTSSDLYGIWGSQPNDVFAVGSFGWIVHYDGVTWSPMTSGTAERLMGVWGSGPNDVFAVGYVGTIVHYDGVNWSPMTSGTTLSFQDVWGSSPNSVVAVGFAGAAYYNSSLWNVYNWTTWYVWDTWGTGPNDVFYVGWYEFDASAFISHAVHIPGWQSITYVEQTMTLLGVWGSGSNDVFAVGSFGAILHYDGIEWSEMTSETSYDLHEVWGSGPSDVFAVGQYGTILHHPPRPRVLEVNYVNPVLGLVIFDPEPNDPHLPAYPLDTIVTLTAIPSGNGEFRHWGVYDPNFPGDANYVAVDSNNPITVLMDADREVTAVFKCGTGVGHGFPLLLIGAAGVYVVVRRKA